MKKTVRTLLTIILIISLVSVPAAMAEAQMAPRSNAYVASFDNRISALGDGKVKIEFETCGTGTMDVIGAYVIKLYDQNCLVYTLKMTNSDYTAQMIGTNRTHFYGSVTYNGVSGNTYNAVVTHYAAKNGGTGTENYTTNSVVA